jgi:ribulose kinase
VRHILETLKQNGQSVSMLHVTGGHVRNPLLMELYADATGCIVSEPKAEDATLLGTAMTAAAAAGVHAGVAQACAAMDQGATMRMPNPDAAERFETDYLAFLAMHRHRREIEEIVGK